MGCPAADRPVDGLSRAEARAATVCEIRRQRRLTGRAVVRPDAQLHTATRRHARLMVKQDCYEHICRGEASIEGRLFKSGYLRGARNWSYGENIGCATSVRQMIATWLANEPSRKILLGKAYRDIGATVTKGVPSEAQNCTSDPSYGTFTVLLAVRQPR
ncbi:MAG: CAP domain-containing protein [Solirubrobacterales bacterium]|nr:CAP domain-containing protein [Solirubrobacterales bacterium]